MRRWISISVLALIVVAPFVSPRSLAQTPYTPKPVFCATSSVTELCSVLPAYIGPDPRLENTSFGYNGLFGPPPTQATEDVQTPFDNMAWQMFVALNWAASAVKQPPATGLTTPGRRVWQTYREVSALFGNSKVVAGCTNALALPVFYIGSDGKGTPEPNNAEYFQASTNKPLIDINGNWTIFERRVNDIEAKYLLAPNGQATQTLTTLAGQQVFITHNKQDGVQFTASSTVADGTNGSIEIKAAWRIIDRAAGDDPSRYYTQPALLAVSGDLVRGGRQFCSSVLVGLVGLHIIQRNPVDATKSKLLPQWIWASFEHVDNAPMALSPCDLRDGRCGVNDWINQPSCGLASPSPSTRYSFFRQDQPLMATNVAPQSPGNDKTKFPWNPRPPYARGGTTAATAMPQAIRCWSIYPTTASLNVQWQTRLAALNSVFKNYMLIGTQWGGPVEPPAPPNPLPGKAVPSMLSNITLETYIQNYTGSDSKLPGPGSCVACHDFAKLPADNNSMSANFSFLPRLADPPTARTQIKTAE